MDHFRSIKTKVGCIDVEENKFTFGYVLYSLSDKSIGGLCVIVTIDSKHSWFKTAIWPPLTGKKEAKGKSAVFRSSIMYIYCNNLNYKQLEEISIGGDDEIGVFV